MIIADASKTGTMKTKLMTSSIDAKSMSIKSTVMTQVTILLPFVAGHAVFVRRTRTFRMRIVPNAYYQKTT